MPHVSFIGAGSMVFARKLISDLLSYPGLADSTLSLVDIDEERLRRTTEAAEILASKSEGEPTIQSTTDRRTALENADYVINMINVGGLEPFENEIRIPETYGIEQAIGDTVGPGGIFRGLRTIPTVIDIASDMEEICPSATLFNYTNPMAIVCWAVYEATDVEIFGLCHSIPGTAEQIADYIGAPVEELQYLAAGINHLAWFITCEWNDEDVVPLLEEAMQDPETFRRDPVRFEVMRHFGAFLTESSHHLSEYLPYFRTDRDTIEKMSGVDAAGRMDTASYLQGWRERSRKRDRTDDEIEPDELTIERSEEYASRIIHSMESGIERRVYVNTRNAGAISNLRPDACVEIPALVDGTGVNPCRVGDLPPQMAALVRSNIDVQELAVKAALTRDRRAVHQAVMCDPLTAASATLEEIHEMTEELLEANAEYVPEFT